MIPRKFVQKILRRMRMIPRSLSRIFLGVSHEDPKSLRRNQRKSAKRIRPWRIGDGEKGGVLGPYTILSNPSQSRRQNIGLTLFSFVTTTRKTRTRRTRTLTKNLAL